MLRCGSQREVMAGGGMQAVTDRDVGVTDAGRIRCRRQRDWAESRSPGAAKCLDSSEPENKNSRGQSALQPSHGWGSRAEATRHVARRGPSSTGPFVHATRKSAQQRAQHPGGLLVFLEAAGDHVGGAVVAGGVGGLERV